jgi:transitional endoplasmic reticulum ATPase
MEMIIFAIVQLFLVPFYFKGKTRGAAMVVGTACLLYNIFGMTGTPVLDLLRSDNPFVPTLSALYSWATLLTYLAVIGLFLKIRRELNDVMQRVPVAQSAATGGTSDNLAVIDFNVPMFSFTDVTGMTALKALLTKAASDIVTGEKNGILLYGEPGNGKTFIAEAFAGELHKMEGMAGLIDRSPAFMSASIADLGSQWVGKTTEQVKSMFAQAAQAARHKGACVLFLDEVDALLRDRNDTNVSRTEDSLQTVNTFLDLISRYRNFKKYRIILMMATNYRDKLDEAAIRDGRVDFKFEIPNPDFDAIVGLLLSNCKAAKLSPSIAKQVAGRWDGFSVARIRAVAERAGKHAKEKGQTDVTFDDLMFGLREAQGGIGVRLKAGTKRLAELHFDDELKHEIGLLANRMKRVVEIEQQGGTIPKGVMFYGPPGTGKTAVTQALALESGWAFLPTTGNKLSMDQNAFDNLVKKALDLRPCIVFIDEADDILANREISSSYQKSLTNNLLAVLDGDRPIKDVMFVAATNNPQMLDPACVRRFPEVFEFDLPSDDALLSVIREFMDAKANAPWDDDFTPENALTKLSGQSPAMARELLQRAINMTVAKLDDSKISLTALDSVMSAQLIV